MNIHNKLNVNHSRILTYLYISISFYIYTYLSSKIKIYIQLSIAGRLSQDRRGVAEVDLRRAPILEVRGAHQVPRADDQRSHEAPETEAVHQGPRGVRATAKVLVEVLNDLNGSDFYEDHGSDDGKDETGIGAFKLGIWDDL